MLDVANQHIETKDLIRPLSLEAIRYFSSEEELPLEGPSYERRTAKFVRLGQVMLVGLTVPHGPSLFDGRQKVILHLDLFGTMVNEGLHQSVPDDDLEAEPFLRGGVDLHDAGYISIASRQDTLVLNLSRESYDFGRADEMGRQRSVEVAQKLVSDSVRVMSRD